MAGEALDRLVGAGLLARKPADRARVVRWSARSRKDLALAATVLASLDLERAMAVAYEAGYRACAGILDRARRFRNEALYGDVARAGSGEFEQLLEDVAWLIAELERQIGGSEAKE